jgi:hypothetical protein
MIEAELCFFEMEVEGMFGDAVELEQAAFGEAPEAFDAVDVLWSAGELVVGVADPEVLVEAEIDQAVVTSPARRYGARIRVGLCRGSPPAERLWRRWERSRCRPRCLV